MRLTILCEGDTEERVLKYFLQPYCGEFESIQVISSKGASKLEREFPNITELTLRSDEEAIVICLIDLYEAPFEPPKHVLESYNPLIAHYSYIKKYMEEKIDSSLRDRFYAFPVVMEIETWLFADVSVLNSFFRTTDILAYTAPETLNHPAKQLNDYSRRYRNREYSKVIDGQALFNRIEAKTVFEDNCPHFNLIINQLLHLQNLETQSQSMSVNIPDNHLYHQFAQLYQQREHLEEESLQASSDSELTDYIERIDQIDKAIHEIQQKLPKN